MAVEFLLNDELVRTAEPAGLLLLDWLRLRRRKVGTKEGCKEGDCGACTVMVGTLEPGTGRVRYRTVTSCLMPLGELQGRHLLTIEGLNLPPGELNPVQQAMVEEGGSQCGFCTPGFIVSMCWYLMQSPDESPDAQGLEHAIGGNLCRCTGYGAIWRANDRLVERFSPGGLWAHVWGADDRIAALVELGLLPKTLAGVAEGLAALQPEAAPQLADEPPSFLVAGGTDLYVQRGEEIPEVDGRGAGASGARRSTTWRSRLTSTRCAWGRLLTFESVRARRAPDSGR